MNVMLFRTDCFNGIIGAFRPHNSNTLVDKLNRNGVTDVLVIGVFTEFCVLNMVLTLLFGRNHGLVPNLQVIYV